MIFFDPSCKALVGIGSIRVLIHISIAYIGCMMLHIHQNQMLLAQIVGLQYHVLPPVRDSAGLNRRSSLPPPSLIDVAQTKQTPT